MVGEPARAEPTAPGVTSPRNTGEPRRSAGTVTTLPRLDLLSRVAAGAGDLGGLELDRFRAVARSLSRGAVETGEEVVVGDLSRWPDHDPSAATGMGLVSYASVPVRAPDGGVIGAVCVGDVRRRRWTPAQRAC